MNHVCPGLIVFSKIAKSFSPLYQVLAEGDMSILERRATQLSHGKVILSQDVSLQLLDCARAENKSNTPGVNTPEANADIKKRIEDVSCSEHFSVFSSAPLKADNIISEVGHKTPSSQQHLAQRSLNRHKLASRNTASLERTISKVLQSHDTRVTFLHNLENHILWLHQYVMALSGQPRSHLRDYNSFISAIHRPFATMFQQDLYKTWEAKSVAIFEAIVANHPFIDGNKRTGHIAFMYLLAMNAMWLDANLHEHYRFIMRLTTSSKQQRENIKREMISRIYRVS